MIKTTKTIWMSILLILVLTLVNASQVSNFNSEGTGVTFTFTNDTSTEYISLFNNSNVISTFLDMTGSSSSFITGDAGVYSFNGSWVAPPSNVTSFYDDDWGTNAQDSADAGSSWIFINYTKPTGANRLSTYWEISLNWNYSYIVLPEHCWSYDSEKVLLAVESDTGDTSSTAYCNNGTWHALADNQVTSLIMDETLHWGGFNTCFQETANVSNSCGGLATGSYSTNGTWFTGSPQNMWDESWTSSELAGYQTKSWMFVNYTKPANVINASWRTRDATNFNDTKIPLSCWNYDSTKISLALESDFSTPPENLSTIKYFCYNGGWLNFGTNGTASSFIEEGISWDLNPSYPTNVRIDVFNDSVVDYVNNSLWDNTLTLTIDDTEDAWYYPNTTLIENASFAVDEDWSTYAIGNRTEIVKGTSGIVYIYENYTIPAGAETATLTGKYATEFDATGVVDIAECYTGSTWESVDQNVDSTTPINVTDDIPNRCLDNSPLQLRHGLYYYQGGVGTHEGNVGAKYYESLVTWRFTSADNKASIAFNATQLGSCDCVGCELDTSSYTYPYCTFPFVFSSESRGVLSYDALDMTYYTPPKLTVGAVENYTVTVQKGQNLSLDLVLSHDFNPDINQVASYTLLLQGNNSNATHLLADSSLTVLSENVSETNIQINISNTATTGWYNFSVNVTSLNDSVSQLFPINLNIKASTAVIETNVTTWALGGYADETFTNVFNISNVGGQNATNCIATATSPLDSVFSYTIGNITASGSAELRVGFQWAPAKTYINHYINLQCEDEDGNTVSTSPIQLVFVIISRPASGGGGGVAERRDCDIEVDPKVLQFSKKDELQRLLITNNELFSITPSVRVLEDGVVDIKGTLLPILPAQSQELTILSVAVNDSSTTLLVSSLECTDIVVPIEVVTGVFQTQDGLSIERLGEILNTDVVSFDIRVPTFALVGIETKNINITIKFYYLVIFVAMLISILTYLSDLKIGTKLALVPFGTLIISILLGGILI